MQISKLATITNMPATTIRYYERVGLISPSARQPNGTREYDARHLHQLIFITRARQVGLSIEEMRDILAMASDGNCPCREVHSILDDQIRTIESTISALELQRKRLLQLSTELPPASTPRHAGEELHCPLVAGSIDHSQPGKRG